MTKLQKEILVVEDNRINRAMLKKILSEKYAVLEAANGQEALDILEEKAEEISLILLDIMMPIMDGYTFLNRMKQEPAFAAIPVIVTTQSDSEDDEVTALSYGATDFIVKPYKAKIILHRVASIINLRETAAMINHFQYDSLTGLYTKEFFYQRAHELLMQHPEKEYDLICSNIENFKFFNEIFGIQNGDQLLKEIAQLYRDRVKDCGICGRFSADRFICLLERRWEYEEAMFREINTEQVLPHLKTAVMKWGVYEIEDRNLPVEQMCDRALLAVDSIKGQYGKYFGIYDSRLREKRLRENLITESMEAALAEGQFVVYFQPKYRVRDDQLAGAEALIRWIHPEWGFMSPAEFIPLFEKNGFITRLDQFVWEQVCRLLGEWRDKGYPRVPVSVNVSRADIYQMNLPEYLPRLIEKYQIEPQYLHLEITESAYTDNPDQIIQTVERLRGAGFVIEMDDFGSGYSSLNMLNQMTLDILKLDMKFIQNETAKPAHQGILRFIISLARWMNLSVVAEGVEYQEQLDYLREIGCDYVQGYLFARPMPQADFEALLDSLKQRGLKDGAMKETQYRQELLLVVDEDAAYREQVKNELSDLFQVIEAENETEALACILDGGHVITAVLLSLTLPAQGGFNVLKELRREGAMWRIPILATAPVDSELEARAMVLGADDLAFKPHTTHSLRRWLMRLTGYIPARMDECSHSQKTFQGGQKE